ncbi:eukaryotic translation initiation factor 3 subunit D-like, partial [Centruroides sculpturatus]|uniref:eukaryotic translation initiation factor 3 subunit D-like n=1 Tax=Centruroides sculpturatus TaxID=218467 RepID=UPI000C6EE495
MPIHFVPPVIEDNPSGWGPCSVPEQYKKMPYQPFSKSDRLGKVADWTGATYQDRRYANKYVSQFGTGSQYAYYHEEDESTFQLVDTARVHKPLHQRGRFRMNQQRNLRNRERQKLVQQQQLQVLSKTARGRERYCSCYLYNLGLQKSKCRCNFKSLQFTNSQIILYIEFFNPRNV